MTKPINLNKVRKSKARAAKKARAAENVIRFGQTKSEKSAARKVAQDKKDLLDGKRLSPK